MAAADRFWVNITGRGGHAAMPHLSIDPVIAASQVGSNALLAHAASQFLSCHLHLQAVEALLAGACLQMALGAWLLTCWGQMFYVGACSIRAWKAFVRLVKHVRILCDVPSASTLRRCRTCTCSA